MHPLSVRSTPLALMLLGMSALGACIPYGVGTTARPVPRDSSVRTMVMTVVTGTESVNGEPGANWLAVDGESRRGIDSVSDLGFRIVNGAGLVVNYKRMLTGSRARVLFSVMPGAGFVNMGSHAYGELTLLASRQDRRLRGGVFEDAFVTPYGGIRVMQVAPLNRDAVHDEAVAGGFVGIRIGRGELAISPEVGVFYDRSALGMRSSTVVIVPTLSFHGDALIDAIRDAGRAGGPVFRR